MDLHPDQAVASQHKSSRRPSRRLRASNEAKTPTCFEDTGFIQGAAETAIGFGWGYN
jgi:hypothetical protein